MLSRSRPLVPLKIEREVCTVERYRKEEGQSSSNNRSEESKLSAWASGCFPYLSCPEKRNGLSFEETTGEMALQISLNQA
jgi:hypothetical protein